MAYFEASPAEITKLLQQFKVGQYWKKDFPVGKNPQDTSRLTSYVDRLREAGLDIGKGDSFKFGYKMPLPENDAVYRPLQIFRRF